MRDKDEIQIGSLLSYVKMGMGALVLLIYTPIMIRALGTSEYGVYNAVVSVISMFTVLNLGFGSGYVRYFVKNRTNKEYISKLNGMFLLIFLVIGAVALVAGLVLTVNIEVVFKQGFIPEELRLARNLMFFQTISLACSFPMTVFSSIIAANERFVFLRIFEIVKVVMTPLVTIPFLFFGFGSIGVVIISLVVSLVVDLSYILYVFITLDNRFCFKNFEKGLFKSLFSYTSFIAIHIIVNQINSNLDNVLLGRYVGTESVSVYSVGFSIYHYYVICSTAISNVFSTRVHNLVHETEGDIGERKKKLTELFVKVGRVQFLILGLVATGVIFFGKKFVYYWAGPEFEESYHVAIILILSISIDLIQNVGNEMQRAQNLHWFSGIVYGGMAVVNWCISIILCQKYGAIGCATGTAISFVFANGLAMNIFYDKKCNIDIRLFWRNILRMSAGLLVPVLVGIGIKDWINQVAIVPYVILIVVYTIIYAVSMWIFAMNAYEKKIVKKMVRKLCPIIK